MVRLVSQRVPTELGYLSNDLLLLRGRNSMSSSALQRPAMPDSPAPLLCTLGIYWVTSPCGWSQRFRQTELSCNCCYGSTTLWQNSPAKPKSRPLLGREKSRIFLSLITSLTWDSPTINSTRDPFGASPAPAHTTAVRPPWAASVKQAHHEHPHQRHPAPPVLHRASAKTFQCPQRCAEHPHGYKPEGRQEALPAASQLLFRFCCASDKH